MAKSRPTVQKRLKELAKLEKKQAKAQRRAQRQAAKDAQPDELLVRFDFLPALDRDRRTDRSAFEKDNHGDQQC